METSIAKSIKKIRYLSKKVKFGPKEFTMWSIDGVTWSTRKEELTMIQDRHEAERQKLMQGVAERVAEERKNKPVVAAAAVEAGTVEEDGPVLVTSPGDDEEDAPVAKPKSKKKVVSARDRVQFVAPKPREIAKAKNKPAPNKKRKAA